MTRLFLVALLFAFGCETNPTSSIKKSPGPPSTEPIPVPANEPLLYIEELPAVAADPQPMLVVLHGYGANERDLLRIAKQLGDQFFIVGIRAPIELGDDRYAWYPRGRKPGDPSRRHAAEEVLRVIRDLPRTGVDQGKRSAKRAPLFLAGFSQGGAIALETASIATPEDVDGVVAFSPAPFQYSGNTPAFVSHGAQDKVVPFATIEDLAERESNLKFVRFSGGHTIPRDIAVAAREWVSAIPRR